ncbi:MAG: PAS domain-containing protein [Natrialbaceae archaeon]|nr:PAS domain-containing protein [Natrialbaceae archaeon]
MGDEHSLARSTLDTLAPSVAVIDETGEILLTNRSWRQFGPDASSGSDLGVNYLSTTQGVDDEFAATAARGLEAVIAGEQETFSHEYPCHTPESEQWFLMRVRRFFVDDELRVSIVHLDITERRLAERDVTRARDELEDERDALAHLLGRIEDLIPRVTEAAVGSPSREELEDRVCTALVEADPYEVAWFGRAALGGDGFERGATATAGSSRISLGRPDQALQQVLDTGEPRVVSDVDDFSATVALPIEYGTVSYGILVIHASEPDAFDPRR